MTGMHQPLYTVGGIISCFFIALERLWDNYCRSSCPNQTRTLTFSWTSKFACKYVVHFVFLDYLDYLKDYLFNFDCRCKSDFKGGKDVLLIGQGFQNIMDIYFWYLPFASVWQCKTKHCPASMLWTGPRSQRTIGGPNVKTLQTNTR
jgi:hypothetical protein